MKKMFLLFILFILNLSVYARLGENEAQCKKRYGTPVLSYLAKDGYTHQVFRKNLFLIALILDKNQKTVEIVYSKPDPNNLFFKQSSRTGDWMDILLQQRHLNLKLTPYEISFFLKINSDKEKWAEILPGSSWRLENGTMGSYNDINHTLSITSPAYMQYLKEKTSNDLSGF
jgi:hypothetical protein